MCQSPGCRRQRAGGPAGGGTLTGRTQLWKLGLSPHPGRSPGSAGWPRARWGTDPKAASVRARPPPSHFSPQAAAFGALSGQKPARDQRVPTAHRPGRAPRRTRQADCRPRTKGHPGSSRPARVCPPSPVPWVSSRWLLFWGGEAFAPNWPTVRVTAPQRRPHPDTQSRGDGTSPGERTGTDGLKAVGLTSRCRGFLGSLDGAERHHRAPPRRETGQRGQPRRDVGSGGA